MQLLREFLEFELVRIGEYSLEVITLFIAVLILVITKLVLWLIKKSIFHNKNLEEFNEGNTYSLYQIRSLGSFYWLFSRNIRCQGNAINSWFPSFACWSGTWSTANLQ